MGQQTPPSRHAEPTFSTFIKRQLCARGPRPQAGTPHLNLSAELHPLALDTEQVTHNHLSVQIHFKSLILLHRLPPLPSATWLGCCGSRQPWKRRFSQAEAHPVHCESRSAPGRDSCGFRHALPGAPERTFPKRPSAGFLPVFPAASPQGLLRSPWVSQL